MGKIVKLRKVGDSLTITVPHSLAESLNWSVGDNIEINIIGVNQLSISKK